MRVFLGSDHAGFPLKQTLIAWLGEQGHEAVDLGTHDQTSCDYPEFAHKVAAAVRADAASRGVLVCGTGLGMVMAANRHPGIRAALCHHEVEAALTREHNDANVLVLGGRIIGELLAVRILAVFLATGFAGGRHQRRVTAIEPSAG